LLAKSQEKVDEKATKKGSFLDEKVNVFFYNSGNPCVQGHGIFMAQKIASVLFSPSQARGPAYLSHSLRDK
jgi:hypothetical protein